MDKKSRILAFVLGVFIIVILVMLSLTPVLKGRSKNSDVINEIEQEKYSKINDDEGKLDDDNENNNPSLSDNVVDITLGVNSLVHGEGARINGGDIIIMQGGTYNISGDFLDGTIFVDTIFDVVLKLNGVNITTQKEAINIKGSKVEIELNKDNYINSSLGGIVSNSSLVIKGDGVLKIQAGGKGIDALDGVDIRGGDIFVVEEEKSGVKDNSGQSVVSFSFQNKLNGIKQLSFRDDESEILGISLTNSFKNVLISSKRLENKNYSLIKIDENNGEEKVIINNTDSFYVASGYNLYSE